MPEILHFQIGFARQKSIGLPTQARATAEQNKRKTPVRVLRKLALHVAGETVLLASGTPT
jgi:hypothetical protein